MVTLLNIRVILVDDLGTVAGSLEPYHDPDCGCLLSTTFVGHLVGDRITGEFISNGGAGHPPAFGRWRVDRH